MLRINWLRLLIFSIIIYSLFIIIPGFYNIKDSISLIPPKWWLISIIFTISSHFILSIRWFYFLKYLKQHISYLDSFKIYLAGLSLMASPARSAESIRSFWLSKRHYIKLGIGFSMTLAERLGDLLSALLLIIFCIGNINFIILYILIMFICLYSFKYLSFNLFKPRIKKIFNFILTKFPFIEKYKLNNHFHLTLKNTRYLFKPIPFLISIFLVSFSWLLESFLLYLTFKYLNVDISFQQSTLIRTSMGIGGALSLLPAGLLTSESTSIAISLAYGADKIEAFTATLFIRVYTLFIPSLIGLIAMILQKDLNTSPTTQSNSN